MSNRKKNFITIVNKIKKFVSDINSEQDVIDNLESLGYAHLAKSKSTLRNYKQYLDAQALSLVGNNDAYYRNRLQSWILTDKIKQGGI